MTLIKNPSHDPSFCLAAEQFILENLTEGEYLMLWRGERSVIVGKNQNVYGEVSLLECEKHGTPIFRRNSGGGTVYHDLGNVNFSFFSDMGERTDYARFLTPVVEFLRSLGVPAEMGESFDITVNGKKVSGNAQSVHRGRVMHHGTLLFDADITALSSLTSHAREKAVSKAVKSNPAPVGNISDFLPQAITVEEFEKKLGDALSDKVRSLTSDELRAIESLAEEKYRTWEWNCGRSPIFELHGEHITLSAKNGVVLSAGEGFESLIGCRLIPSEILSVLKEEYDRDTAEMLIKDIFD